MDGMTVIAYIFGMAGVAFGTMAFVQVQKLTKTLKEKGILDEDHRED